MKLEIVQLESTGTWVCRVEHRGEILSWDGTYYGVSGSRSKSIDLDTVFQELNGYLATRSMEEQDFYFACYQEIRDLMDTPGGYGPVTLELRAAIAKLYSQLNLDDLRYWMLFHSNVRIPSDLKEVHELHVPEGRTYLRNDYIDLAVLTIAFRFMTPIWSEYIENIRDDGGAFKEYQAGSLLYDANITRSPAYLKLKEYVELTVASKMKDDDSIVVIIGGLSSAEFAQWVMSICITRRLANGHISAVSDSNNLVSNIYNTIGHSWDSAVRSFGSKYGKRISKKDSPGKSEEDKTSFIELYKIKQQVADGSLEIFSVYTEDYHHMARVLEPNISSEMVEMCFQSAQELVELEMASELIPLTQWTISNIIPARAVPLLNRPAVIRTMAVAQAALWHWGFFDIAALVTASKIIIPETIFINSTEPKSRISKEMVDELERRYPYAKRIRNGNEKSQRRKNMAYVAIDTFIDQTRPYDWKLHCPDALIAQLTTPVKRRRMSMPIDIREQLTQLFLDVVSQPRLQSEVTNIHA